MASPIDAGEAIAAAALKAFGASTSGQQPGIGGLKPLMDSDDALIDRIIDTNLASMMRITALWCRICRARRAHHQHLLDLRPGRLPGHRGLCGGQGRRGAVHPANSPAISRRRASRQCDAPSDRDAMTAGHRRNPLYVKAAVEARRSMRLASLHIAACRLPGVGRCQFRHRRGCCRWMAASWPPATAVFDP